MNFLIEIKPKEVMSEQDIGHYICTYRDNYGETYERDVDLSFLSPKLQKSVLEKQIKVQRKLGGISEKGKIKTNKKINKYSAVAKEAGIKKT